MATTYKVLGQSNPAATTNTDIYTVPASTSTIISTIVVANLTGTAATFNLAIRKAGAAISNAAYIAYQVTVGASDSTTLTLGLTLATTDVVTAYASTANLAFNIFGSEIA
jgi:glucose-6-phosphate dehydrogenase assembly protein OpcA